LVQRIIHSIEVKEKLTPINSAQGTKYAEGLGRLAAKIHTIPTSWYDEHRAALKDRFPVLCEVPDDCFIWPWAKEVARFSGFLASIDQSQMRRLVAAFPKPTSPAMRKLTTVHGDLWSANICSPPDHDGYMCIDLDWSAVTLAVVGWGHWQSVYCLDRCAPMLEAQGLPADHLARRQMQVYLSDIGAPCGEEDVAVARFDAEWACRMVSRGGCKISLFSTIMMIILCTNLRIGVTISYFSM